MHGQAVIGQKVYAKLWRTDRDRDDQSENSAYSFEFSTVQEDKLVNLYTEFGNIRMDIRCVRLD